MNSVIGLTELVLNLFGLYEGNTFGAVRKRSSSTRRETTGHPYAEGDGGSIYCGLTRKDGELYP